MFELPTVADVVIGYLTIGAILLGLSWPRGLKRSALRHPIRTTAFAVQMVMGWPGFLLITIQRTRGKDR